MIQGAASSQGTQGYAERHKTNRAANAYRPLGDLPLTTSCVGFGCYRVGLEDPIHAESLEKALLDGCNLIDTSTNYTDGQSETCVGQVLEKLIGQNKLKRDETVIVSKVGYVQGKNLELARQREAENRPFPDMVRYMDGCWHNIHPDFIQDQISRSLDRLKLSQIDVMLLHNPEYYLLHEKKKGTPKEEAKAQFYERIRLAFDALEEAVATKRISYYGVSSNTFGTPAGAPDATSVSKMREIAEAVAKTRKLKKSHFKVIQLPLNIIENGPFLERNTGDQDYATALQFSAEHGIGVLVNRPLNASVGNQLLRLADYPVDSEAGLETALRQIQGLESQFAQDLAPKIETTPGSIAPKDFFNLGKELANPALKKITYDHWRQLETDMVMPQIRYLLSQLDDHFSKRNPEVWKEWRSKYGVATRNLLAAIRSITAKNSRQISQGISRKIAPFLPANIAKESLSKKALAIVANTEGVSCVLNGMRTPEYVDDALGVLSMPPFPVTTSVSRAFKAIG